MGSMQIAHVLSSDDVRTIIVRSVVYTAFPTNLAYKSRGALLSVSEAAMPDQDLLRHLNPFQREVVLHDDIRPLLVLAAAGVGKTTALTTRIAYLMRVHGVPAERILAVTFTNKAAKEMRDRVAKLTATDDDDGRASRAAPDVGTFHSVCAKILRVFAAKLGLKSDFKINDQKEATAMMSSCLQQIKGGRSQGEEFVKLLTSVRWFLDMWRNNAMEPAAAARAVADKQRRTFDTGKQSIQEAAAAYAVRIYPVYEELCRRSNIVDMADLIMHVVRLFRHHPEALEYCRQRWSHILVDEFQDTNPVQFEFVRTLATPQHHLMVVGDDSQCIHEWRGASIRNIMEFEKDFVDPRIIKLEHNYRSTQVILDAANALIRHNTVKRDKVIICTKERGAPIGFSRHDNEWDEAVAVASMIKDLLANEACAPGEIAVLYRINAASKNIEQALHARGVPFKVRGGTSFWERAEVKDVLAYLRLVCPPADDGDVAAVPVSAATLDRAFVRVLNVPARGIGGTTIKRLQEAAAARGTSLMAVTREVVDDPKNTKIRARKVLAAFLGMVDAYRARLTAAADADVAQVSLELLEEAGYMAMLKKDVDDSALARERMDNVAALVAEIRRAGRSLSHFLMDSVLWTSEDPEEVSMAKVNLLTLHSAKGLEWRKVFIVGCSEGSLPSYFSLKEPAKIEEERRLMYVGITRAMESLHLSMSKTRSSFVRTFSCKPSRFLGEIPAALLEKRA